MLRHLLREYLLLFELNILHRTQYMCIYIVKFFNIYTKFHTRDRYCTAKGINLTLAPGYQLPCPNNCVDGFLFLADKHRIRIYFVKKSKKRPTSLHIKFESCEQNLISCILHLLINCLKEAFIQEMAKDWIESNGLIVLSNFQTWMK